MLILIYFNYTVMLNGYSQYVNIGGGYREISIGIGDTHLQLYKIVCL